MIHADNLNVPKGVQLVFYFFSVCFLFLMERTKHAIFALHIGILTHSSNDGYNEKQKYFDYIIDTFINVNEMSRCRK